MINTVIQGDCLQVMKKIEDKSIDMIACDLPYGTTACKWDTIIPFEPLWEQYKRIIKDNGAIVLTASQPFTSKLVMSNLEMFKYEWIWHKNSSGSFATAKKLPMKYHENVLVFYKKLPIYNPQFEKYSDSTINRFKNGDVRHSKKINTIQGITPVSHRMEIKRGRYPQSVQFIKSPTNSNSKRLHPTQKPVALFEYLIKTYTNGGDLVLDNCAGSGTTGVACINTNRNYILIEKDENYCNICKKRIKEALEKQRLF